MILTKPPLKTLNNINHKVVTVQTAYKHNKNHIELFGTKGAINVPDPSYFGGEIKICTEKNSDWKTIKTDDMNLGRLDANQIGGEKNFRGIGVSEMIDSIINNKENRCSGELSLHVLDIIQSIMSAARKRKRINIKSTCNIPKRFTLKEIKMIMKFQFFNFKSK